MARIALVFGGRSVEHRVSIVSARAVCSALLAAGHEVVPVGIDPAGAWLGRELGERALAGELDAFDSAGTSIVGSLEHLRSADPDVVFPLVHGTWGEDGTLQGLCEMLDLPYVGAGVAASALAMDKVRCKAQLAMSGLPVVPYATITAAELGRDVGCLSTRCEGLSYPLFAKPANGGSSVGVKRVDSPECLASSAGFALQFDETALLEEGIVGRELECSVLGYPNLKASAVGEIVPGNDFYDYADKYLEDDAELLIPAPLTEEVADRVRDLAVRAFAAIGGWGMARVDFLLRGEDELFINEINTLPGFTSISMYPKLWEESGIPMPKLVDHLVDQAVRRHADRAQLDRQIREFLAGLQPAS